MKNQEKIIIEINKKFDKLNKIGKIKLIVFLIQYLGYKEIKNENDILKNEEILSLIFPSLNFFDIFNTYSNDEKMRKDLIDKINASCDNLISYGLVDEPIIKLKKGDENKC